jgi:integrase
MLELNTAIHAKCSNFKSSLLAKVEDRVSAPLRKIFGVMLPDSSDTPLSEQDNYKCLSAYRLLSFNTLIGNKEKNLLTIPARVRETGTNEAKRKEFVSQLFGDAVLGAINSKQKCPTCNGKFSDIDNNGLYCPECKTRPTRYYITAKKIGISFLYSNPTSKEPFETYSQALRTLTAINHSYQDAISKGKKFDTSKWVPSEYKENLIENLCNRWLKNYEPEVRNGLKSKDYVDSLHTICNSFIVNYFKGKHIDDIDDDDIEKFYHWLLDKTYSTEKGENNYSSDYIDTILKTFKSIYMRYRPKNTLRFPTITVVPVKEKQRLGLARELAILEHIPERNGYRLAMLILLRTGVRINEIPALKKKDFIDGLVYVEKAMSDGKFKLRRKAGGTVSHRLDPDVWQIAMNHMHNLEDDDFVFTVDGRNMTTGRLYKVWTKACKKAGQRHISLRNASRTSMASDIWEEHMKMALEKIGNQLGDNPETVKKYYVIE